MTESETIAEAWGLTRLRELTQRNNPDDAPAFFRTMQFGGTISYRTVETGRLGFAWTPQEAVTHPDGGVQGGVVVVVADFAQAFVTLSLLEEHLPRSTVDFDVRYFSLIRSGEPVLVDSVAINRSNRNTTIETTFTRERDGRLLAKVTGGWVIAPGRSFQTKTGA